MSGPRFPFQRIREGILLDRDRKIGGIHFFDTRPKQYVHAGRATKIIVGFFWPWIFFIVAPRRKLKRINEDTDRDFALGTRGVAANLNQLAMASMQCAHCRNKHASPRSVAR